jgi:hypothetical protein
MQDEAAGAIVTGNLLVRRQPSAIAAKQLILTVRLQNV